MIPFKVFASSAYLKSFEVINGTLSIPFNEKNNVYTIYLNEGVTSLEYTYELENENANVEITGENIEEGKENIMTIKIIENDTKETQNYVFYLEPIKTKSVNLDLSNVKALDTQKEIPHLKEITISICSVIIFILFKLLILNFFKKRKNQ